MVSKEQFKILLKAMKAVYTDPKFIPDQNAFNTWYAMLNDLDYPTLSKAVEHHLKTETSIPTIAGLRKQVADMKNDSLPDLEAWALVSKAIRDSTYHSQERFNALPDAVKKAVGSPSNLRQWALLEQNTLETVTQSQFLRAYRTVTAQLEREMQISTGIVNPEVEIAEKSTGILEGD